MWRNDMEYIIEIHWHKGNSVEYTYKDLKKAKQFYTEFYENTEKGNVVRLYSRKLIQEKRK